MTSAPDQRTLPLEPTVGISTWEGARIDWMGRRDRLRSRNTPEHNPTHYLLELERQVQHGEIRVIRWANSEVAVIDEELAKLRVVAATQIPEPATAFPAPEGQGVTPRDRQRWAADTRATERALAEREHLLRRVATARERVPALEARRKAVLVRARDLRALWRQVYEFRAARYTRARTGVFGYSKSEALKIRPYQTITPPPPIPVAAAPAAPAEAP